VNPSTPSTAGRPAGRSGPADRSAARPLPGHPSQARRPATGSSRRRQEAIPAAGSTLDASVSPLAAAERAFVLLCTGPRPLGLDADLIGLAGLAGLVGYGDLDRVVPLTLVRELLLARASRPAVSGPAGVGDDAASSDHDQVDRADLVLRVFPAGVVLPRDRQDVDQVNEPGQDQAPTPEPEPGRAAGALGGR
jgi:hypothetical protein